MSNSYTIPESTIVSYEGPPLILPSERPIASHPFAHDMTGTTSFGTLPAVIPPDPEDFNFATEPYTKHSVWCPVIPNPPPITDTRPPAPKPFGIIPTLNNSYTRAERQNFARTRLSDATKTFLNCPFGKDTINACFLSEPALRHCLLSVYKSGFIKRDDASWTTLRKVYHPADAMLRLWEAHGDLDFNSLRGYPDTDLETDMNKKRMAMTTAALMHFDGNIGALVRWVQGPHIAAHRDAPAILAKWKSVLRPHTYAELSRVYLLGAPKSINAESTEANLMDYKRYGNHSTVDAAPDKTIKSVVKDNKRGYALALDARVFWITPNIHLTPMGMVDLDHPNKSPRPIFDASFRPEIWNFALNDWLDKNKEPPVFFAETFLLNLIWIWNLRITYPDREIYLGEDDQAGAFRHCKHPPSLVGLHCVILFGMMIAYTGQTFGSGASPGNYEPVSNSVQQVAEHIWAIPDIVRIAGPYLPKIVLEPEPPRAICADFGQATRDSQNRGVLDANGRRLPPPFVHHVDDKMYADVSEFMLRTVAAAVLSIYEILGYPKDRLPHALSLEKFHGTYNCERKELGYLINSRTMTVDILPYKRKIVVDLLESWLTLRTYSLREAAELIGMLESLSRYNVRGRTWFFALQNEMRDCIKARYHIAKRIFSRSDKPRKLWRDLPLPLRHRYINLCAKEEARLLWSAHVQMSVSSDLRDGIRALHTDLADPKNSWAAPIASIVPRDTSAETYGDASGIAGGGWSQHLRFWFAMDWSKEVLRRHNLPSSDDTSIHINSLEFAMVIVQIAAIVERIRGMPDWLRNSLFPNGVTVHAIFLIWTDNTSAKRWTNHLTTKSRMGQRLICILGDLLREFHIGINCHHIPGLRNIIADFISRPEQILLPPRVRLAQIYAKHPLLRPYEVFLPSHGLIVKLRSALLSKQVAVRGDLPATLGRFVNAESISTCFVKL